MLKFKFLYCGTDEENSFEDWQVLRILQHFCADSLYVSMNVISIRGTVMNSGPLGYVAVVVSIYSQHGGSIFFGDTGIPVTAGCCH
jgi:hypothetical protein